MRRYALLIPLLAVTLAGCGGGAGSNPAAPSAPAALPRYATLAELGAATAAQQKIDKTAKLTITGGVKGGSAQAGLNGEGALRYDEAGPSLQLNQQMQAGAGSPPSELSLVVLPDSAFVKLPASAGLPLPPGKSWLKIQPGATDPVSAQFGQLIQAVRDNADPAKSFAQFGDAVSIVEAVEDPLDGVRAERYKLRVDLARAAAVQTDPAIKQSLEQSTKAGLTTLDYTLWMDALNHTMRVLVDQPLPANQGTFTLDARYKDWGQPVQIAAPPADQVVGE